MKKLLSLMLVFLISPIYAGCIIRNIVNNSSDTEVIVLDVERPKHSVGAKKFSSDQGYGWAIQSKRYDSDQPRKVNVIWSAGAYKYIIVRKKSDGLSCTKYCLLVEPQQVSLRKRDSCNILPNERCGVKNDDFPDQTQSAPIKGSCYIDLYLNKDGEKLNFTVTPQKHKPHEIEEEKIKKPKEAPRTPARMISHPEL